MSSLADATLAKRWRQVHDELVLEVPDQDLDAVRAAVCSQMVAVADLAVPLAVDAGDGPTWDEAH